MAKGQEIGFPLILGVKKRSSVCVNISRWNVMDSVMGLDCKDTIKLIIDFVKFTIINAENGYAKPQKWPRLNISIDMIFKGLLSQRCLHDSIYRGLPNVHYRNVWANIQLALGRSATYPVSKNSSLVLKLKREHILNISSCYWYLAEDKFWANMSSFSNVLRNFNSCTEVRIEWWTFQFVSTSAHRSTRVTHTQLTLTQLQFSICFRKQSTTVIVSD